MNYALIAAFVAIGGLTGTVLALIFGWTVWVSAVIGAAVPALIIFGMFLMMFSIIEYVMSLRGKK